MEEGWREAAGGRVMAKAKAKERAKKQTTAKAKPVAPMATPLRLEYRCAAELAENPANWRKHPKAQLDALRDVIADVGWAGVVLFNETTGRLIDGHARKEIAGSDMVPVLIGAWSEAQERQILSTLDPLAAMAVADKERLDALLRTVQTGSESVAKMLEDVGRRAGCEWAKERDRVRQDEVPEVPKVAVTKPGDLWVMGDCKLLCGDSTSPEDVKRLFGKERAGLCFTSPPYAQQRDYTKKIDDWDALMQGVFGNLDLAMEDAGQVLVNLGLVHREGEWLPYWDGWIEWMRGQGWRRFGWYAWDQGSGLPGDWNGRLAPSHEFVFHFHKTSPDTCGGPVKIPDSCIRVYREQSRGMHTEAHSAVFPVELASFMMHSWPGIAFDPFAGSGTTLIAAHQLNRRAYCIELAPQYCDVAVRRWEALTNQKATLEARPS